VPHAWSVVMGSTISAAGSPLWHITRVTFACTDATLSSRLAMRAVPDHPSLGRRLGKEKDGARVGKHVSVSFHPVAAIGDASATRPSTNGERWASAWAQ
jgi:hypothetical protein